MKILKQDIPPNQLYQIYNVALAREREALVNAPDKVSPFEAVRETNHY
jgi:hypothetical protein